MRRHLVVAHRTLGGAHLGEAVRARLDAGPCQFHLLVPVHHPTDHVWTEHEVEQEAQRVLDAGLARFAELGAEASGEVGDANPVYAIDAVLRREPFDEIILSTLPPGPSRWLKLDVPSRVAREFSLPVVHLVAAPESIGG
jgi:hypothetical protein